jgi:hypothetical protein
MLFQSDIGDEVSGAQAPVLDAVLLAPQVKRDSATAALTAWFGLRAREYSGPQPGGAWFEPEALQRMIRTVVR